VLQAAVNSTEPKHNSFADPQIIETTAVHLPELRFMRHSLLSAWNAPQLMHELHGARVERAADDARHGNVDLPERARRHAAGGDGDGAGGR